MINDCYDLLAYINDHNGILHFSVNTETELGISRDVFNSYIEKLNSNGYINLYIRSCGISPTGKEFLDNN